MYDRVPTKAGRVLITPEDGGTPYYATLTMADEPTQAGTPPTKANLLTDATAALLGLGAAATVTQALAKLAHAATNNLINILHLNLKNALETSDMDAWAEVFTDSSGIDTASSDAFIVDDGVLKPANTSQLVTSGNATFGKVSGSLIASSFVAVASAPLIAVTVKLRKTSTPTDNVQCAIYSNANSKPSTQIAMSSDTVSGSSLTTTPTDKTFTFSGLSLVAGTTYWIVLSRSGSGSTSKYYSVAYSTEASGSYGEYSTDFDWQLSSGAFYSIIQQTAFPAAVYLTAETPSSALTKMAVSGEYDGNVTFAIASGGVETALTEDAATTVDISGAMQLKITLNGADAAVDAVAWGGF